MEIAEPIQKISSIDTKHEAMIHDAQYDYYGKRLATCSSDGYIKVFDVSKREVSIKLASFKAHTGPVWQLSWAHPKFGNILASCGFDKKVCIWKENKMNEWALVLSYSEHQGSVNSISWAPWECGLKLAACSSDGCISIYTRNNDDTWEHPEKFQAHDMGVNSVSWAPMVNFEDLNAQNSQDKNRASLKLASASCDNTIKIWVFDNVKKSFECSQKLGGSEGEGHSDWVRDVAWCPAIGNDYDLLASCSEDQKVILWKIYKTENNNEMKIEKEVFPNFEGPVWRVSWSLAGNMLAVSAANTNSETTVHVFQENEQGKWELLSQVNNDKE